jgi:hypothetical protein
VLEISLQKLGIQPRVLGKYIQPWFNVDKIPLTIQTLREISTTYVLGIDAFDAVVVDDPNRVIGILELYKTEMVFNGTTGKLRSFPSVDLLCDQAFPDHPFRYPNAGVWVGRTAFCQKFFDRVYSVHETFSERIGCMQDDPERYQEYMESEQARVKVVFEEMFPSVMVDYRCEVFQLLNNPELCPEDMRNNQCVQISKICI